MPFILGMRIADVPYVVAEWREQPLGVEMTKRAELQPVLAHQPIGQRRNRVTDCQYKTGRARHTLWGIDEQVAKAEKAIAGKLRRRHRGRHPEGCGGLRNRK